MIDSTKQKLMLLKNEC